MAYFWRSFRRPSDGCRAGRFHTPIESGLEQFRPGPGAGPERMEVVRQPRSRCPGCADSRIVCFAPSGSLAAEFPTAMAAYVPSRWRTRGRPASAAQPANRPGAATRRQHLYCPEPPTADGELPKRSSWRRLPGWRARPERASKPRRRRHVPRWWPPRRWRPGRAQPLKSQFFVFFPRACPARSSTADRLFFVHFPVSPCQLVENKYFFLHLGRRLPFSSCRFP